MVSDLLRLGLHAFKFLKFCVPIFLIRIWTAYSWSILLVSAHTGIFPKIFTCVDLCGLISYQYSEWSRTVFPCQNFYRPLTFAHCIAPSSPADTVCLCLLWNASRPLDGSRTLKMLPLLPYHVLLHSFVDHSSQVVHSTCNESNSLPSDTLTDVIHFSSMQINHYF